MIKKVICLSIVFILYLSLFFSGCVSDTPGTSENKIVGEWVNENGKTNYLFFDNGTVYVGGLIFNWDIEDEKLILNSQNTGASMIYNYSFSDNDNTLHLKLSIGFFGSDSPELIYYRK